METSLRLVLLFIGLVIIAGIIWDSRRSSTTKKTIKPRDRTDSEDLITSDFVEPDISFDECDRLSESPSLEPLFDSIPESFLDDSIEPHLDSSKSSVAHTSSLVQQAPQPKPQPKFEEIIVLNVLARHPGVFLGKKLLDVLTEMHFYYGDMQLFHRYDNVDGSGKPVFSLVSAVEPGIFDLSKMDTFVTPGVTLFFTATRPNQAIAAFELMLRTAKQLMMRMDGELRDEKRRPLTIQAIEDYRDRVRLCGSTPKVNAIQ
jgi:cell division protein ZipA